MPVVLGVDGCKAGWIAAELSGGRLTWHLFATAAELVAHPADLITIDCPIGLPDAGPRSCDVEARRALTGQGSSVFPAPKRAALAARTYAEARTLSVAVDGVSLSAQTWGIVPKIRELDAVAAASGDRLVEAHPELSFRRLGGRRLAGKKTAAGALQRVRLLTELYGPLPDDPPPGAALDDCLDALVLVWTAQRRLSRQADELGGELDSTGLPMRIVV